MRARREAARGLAEAAVRGASAHFVRRPHPALRATFSRFRGRRKSTATYRPSRTITHAAMTSPAPAGTIIVRNAADPIAV